MTITSAYLPLSFILALGVTNAKGPSIIWRLNRRSVAAETVRWRAPPPPGIDVAHGPKVDFFLAANSQSIEASLREAGWQQAPVRPGPQGQGDTDAPLPKLVAALDPPPDAIYTHPDARGTDQEALFLWQAREQGGLHDPLPAWQVSLLPLAAEPADAEAEATDAGEGAEALLPDGGFLTCRNPLADVIDILLDGEARTLPATAPGRASIPFVEMRHSAAEMRRMLLASSKAAVTKTEPDMCPAELLLPVPKRPAMPLPQTVFWHDGMTQKRVAITFDACSTFGHGDYNPAVIAVLEAMHVPATLFIGGHWAEMHPEELQALAANPLFEIGNHTYSHPHMRDLPPEAQKQELLWTQEAIFSRTGVLPRFFRPPYGEVDDALIASVADAGLITVEYDLPAGDADFHVSDTRLIDWVVGKSVPGSIVIMHMNHPGNKTAEVLPAIIRQLRSRGLILSSIGGMLAEQKL